MYRYLLRWRGDGEELYFAGGWQQGTHDGDAAELIGVARTPKHRRPDSHENVGDFKAAVEELAVEVRWFDDPMGVGDAN
jgi:hypothetical protein